MKLNKTLKFIFLGIAIIVSFLIGTLYPKVEQLQKGKTSNNNAEKEVDKEMVLPEKGFDLPISFADFGPRLIELGVIDKDKFIAAVNMTSDEEKILLEGTENSININADNSQFVVDMLWAIGLAQKSIVYTEGPMGKEYKKDVGNFSSTGGWSLAKENATGYLGKFELIELSENQHKRVAEIAKNVYRPCCGNSTWFPDCNHGMAALAAIEMMVAKNMSDDEIYKNILKLNSFWFPSTYMTTAKYFLNKGVTWDKVDAKLILGPEYSSSSGASRITKEIDPVPVFGGGSCGA